MSRDHRFIVILFTGAVYLLLNHLIGFAGHFGYDDMEYARIASRIALGQVEVSDFHFSYRWGLTWPLGFFYRLFGINDHSSALYSLIVTLLTLACILYMTRGERSLQWLASGFFLLHYWTAYYSDKIMPDAMVALAVTLIILALYRQRYINPNQSVLNGLILSFGFLYGLISKESIVLIVPLVLFVFISDIFTKNHLYFWISSIAGSAAFLAIYAFALSLLSASLLSRMDAIIANSYFNPCSYDLLPVSHLYKRITTGLMDVFVVQSTAVVIVFAMAGITSTSFTGYLKLHSPRSFIYFSALATVLCSNFMTTSVSSYVPLCPDIRHFLFIIPVSSIAAAHTLQDFTSSKKHRLLLAILLLTVLGRSLFLHNDWAWWLYLPFLILVFGRWLRPLKSYAEGTVFRILFVLVLFVGLKEKMLSDNNYAEQKSLVHRAFVNTSDTAIVITDVVQKHFGEYYLGFDSSRIRFVDLRRLEPMRREGDCFYLSNGYTRWLSQTEWHQLPPFAQDESKMELVDSAKHVKLFRLECQIAVPAN